MLIVECIESGENVEDKKQKRGEEYKESGIWGEQESCIALQWETGGKGEKYKSEVERWKSTSCSIL